MDRESRSYGIASAFATFAVAAILLGGLVTACMTDEEYQLRKHQLDNQAANKTTFSPLTVEGPIKIELQQGGRVAVTAPGQPFQEIAIPDGIRSQTELIQHLVNVGAISVLGWKAIDGAKGRTTNVTTNNAGATQP